MRDFRPFGRSLLRKALHTDRRLVDELFTIVLLLFVGVLLVLTLGYGKDTRLLPLVVLVPTSVLLLLLLVFQLVPDLSERLGIQGEVTTFDLAELVETDGQAADLSEAEPDDTFTLVEKRKRLVQILLWLIAILTLIVLIGFIEGFLIFLVAFYYYWADQSIRRSIIYALVVWSFIVGLFVVVLGVPFTEGYVNLIVTFI